MVLRYIKVFFIGPGKVNKNLEERVVTASTFLVQLYDFREANFRTVKQPFL